jgi:hypothetical protein
MPINRELKAAELREASVTWQKQKTKKTRKKNKKKRGQNAAK